MKDCKELENGSSARAPVECPTRHCSTSSCWHAKIETAWRLMQPLSYYKCLSTPSNLHVYNRCIESGRHACIQSVNFRSALNDLCALIYCDVFTLCMEPSLRNIPDWATGEFSMMLTSCES